MATIVEYKYTPDQMPVEELKGTFAARQDLLDHLLSHLRQQTDAKSLSSFLLIGPRGAGKTTLVLMLCESIREDPMLSEAWLPLRFREEQFEVCSLRDLLASAIRNLAEQGVASAEAWSARVEQAADDGESQSLAVTALRDIARSEKKRLVLFVENLNLLLGRAFDETSQATLRRLLMVDPFLMLIGTAVQMFEEVEGYDRALFNYFHPLYLEKLDDDQMCELLIRRAKYDGNTAFLEKLQEHRPKFRAISRLTGGNPRMILMVYEIVSEAGVLSAVQILERLVDHLTPMLKHVLEGLPPQQAKILDALMRAGGTSSPAALAQATRLKLNSVTAQLRRLKDNRMVDVLGGGKGQAAHYTVPDQLFCTWYQMRYLQRNRRRIELFVEVIRLWFEAEERLEHLKRFADLATSGGPQARSLAESAEYFAAALRDTPLEEDAMQLMTRTWLHAGEVIEAAMALADLSSGLQQEPFGKDFSQLVNLSTWCRDHQMLPQALETARKAAQERPDDLQAQLACACCALATEDFVLARDQLSRCLAMSAPQSQAKSGMLVARVLANLKLGDSDTSLEDLIVLVRLLGLQGNAVTLHFVALLLRGLIRLVSGDVEGAIGDVLEAIGAHGLPEHQLSLLVCTILVEIVLDRGGTGIVVAMVDAMVAHLESMSAQARAEAEVKASLLLAKLDLRPFWPALVRRLHAKLPEETAQAVSFLLPVACVLEGKGREVLDALPPHERSFALEVLERLEPESTGPETPPTASP